MLSDPNLFLQGNYIARFSGIFGAFIKTQGKLAVIIRCCCFTMISNQFMIQIKCLQLSQTERGLWCHLCHQPANQWRPPSVKQEWTRSKKWECRVKSRRPTVTSGEIKKCPSTLWTAQQHTGGHCYCFTLLPPIGLLVRSSESKKNITTSQCSSTVQVWSHPGQTIL